MHCEYFTKVSRLTTKEKLKMQEVDLKLSFEL